MTSFDEIFDRALHRIEKDGDFFSYFNVSQQETEEIIRQRLLSYLIDSVDKVYEYGNPQINMYDYDLELQQFNVDLTKREIGLLSSLMFLVHLERSEAVLDAFKHRMSPSDLTVFSPKGERDSFMNMLRDVRHECSINLSRYFSTDRLTNEHLTIQHDQYDYES